MACINKKIMAVGDVGCGKTALLIAYSTDNVVDETTHQTLENEIIGVIVDGQEVALSLCSTAGEKSVRLSTCHGDHA